MTAVTKSMLVVQGLFWGAVLVILVFLVVRRIRRREDFEKRDNCPAAGTFR